MKNSARLLVLVTIFILAKQAVFAELPAPKGSIQVTPAFVDIELAEGEQEKKLEISYINHSNTAVTLEMSAIDFKQQGERGEIGFLGQSSGSYSYSLSSFLSFESNQIQLGPGEKRVFKVTVANREDLSPGGHYAAVIAKVVPDGQVDNTSVLPSVSSLILIRKTGGERFNLSMIKANWPPSFISFTYPKVVELLFQNEGNVHVIPYGKVEVRDMFGRLLSKGTINSASLVIFPEVRRYIDAEMIRVGRSFPVSFNTVTIKGQDSIKKVDYINANTYVYINPYFLGIIVILGIFGVISLLKKRKGKKK